MIQLDNAVYTLLAATGVLAANLFKNLNLGVQDADDRILYNDTTGAILYDTNGLDGGRRDPVRHADRQPDGHQCGFRGGLIAALLIARAQAARNRRPGDSK